MAGDDGFRLLSWLPRLSFFCLHWERGFLFFVSRFLIPTDRTNFRRRNFPINIYPPHHLSSNSHTSPYPSQPSHHAADDFLDSSSCNFLISLSNHFPSRGKLFLDTHLTDGDFRDGNVRSPDVRPVGQKKGGGI